MKKQRLVAGLAVIALCCLVLIGQRFLPREKRQKGPHRARPRSTCTRKGDRQDRLSFGPGKDGGNTIKADSTLIYAIWLNHSFRSWDGVHPGFLRNALLKGTGG